MVHRSEQIDRPKINLLKGTLLLLIIGLSWGLMPTLSHILMSQPRDPIGITTWVLAISFALMLVISIVRGRPPVLSFRRLRHATVLGLLGTVLPQIIIYAAAEHVPAIAISIALSAESLIVFLLASAMGIEAPSFKRFLGLCLGLVCVAMIILPKESVPGLEDPVWVLALLLVPLAYAICGLLIATWPANDDDPIQTVTLLMFGGLLCIGPVAYYLGRMPPLTVSISDTDWIIPIISVLSCFTTVAIVYTVRKTGPIFASQKAYSITAGGVIWSILLLNEMPSLWIVCALACMMAGLMLVRPKTDAFNSIEALPDGLTTAIVNSGGLTSPVPNSN